MQEVNKKVIEDAKKEYHVESMDLVSSYNEGYIGKEVYKVVLSNGFSMNMDRIIKGGGSGDAVIILPVTKEGKFVVIVESRPNIKNGIAIEFPAGMVDENELPVIAAKRELLEETGYNCKDIIEIENHFQDQGCSTAIIRIFLATECEKIQDQDLDGTESIKSMEMTYDEVYDLIYNANVNNIGINDSGSKLAFFTYTMKYKR